VHTDELPVAVTLGIGGYTAINEVIPIPTVFAALAGRKKGPERLATGVRVGIQASIALPVLLAGIP
jgi:hypothetical protein